MRVKMPHRGWPHGAGHLFARLGSQLLSLTQNALPRIWILGLGLVPALAVCLPALILGRDASFVIHDHLESNAVWATLLARHDLWFAGPATPVLPFMDGIPRAAFGMYGPLSLYALWFELLPTFWAIVANQAVVHFFAFVGMFLLLRDCLLPDHRDRIWIAAGVAVAFAFLPIWPPRALSVLGVPLIAWALLSIRATGGRWFHWATIPFFALYSSFVGIGIFVGFVFGTIWLVDLLRRHRGLWRRRYFTALSALGGIYIANSFYLFWASFAPGAFPSHRQGMEVGRWPLSQGLSEGWDLFFQNFYQAPSLHAELILPLLAIAAALALLLRRRLAPAQLRDLRKIAWVFLAAMAISLIYVLNYSQEFQGLRQAMSLPYVNLSRFYRFSPSLWMIGLAFALALLVCLPGIRRHSRLLIVVVCFIQAYIGWSAGPTLGAQRGSPDSDMSFARFYSKPLFQEIKREIGKDQATYRTLSVGFHPAILQYNGFYTLDGYIVMYPMSYKETFRAIVAPELARNERWRTYYDNWGSRAYIMASELTTCNFVCTTDTAPASIRLELSPEAFSTFDMVYLLSVSRIKNADHLNLQPEGVFKRKESPWRIHVYRFSG